MKISVPAILRRIHNHRKSTVALNLGTAARVPSIAQTEFASQRPCIEPGISAHAQRPTPRFAARRMLLYGLRLSSCRFQIPVTGSQHSRDLRFTISSYIDTRFPQYAPDNRSFPEHLLEDNLTHALSSGLTRLSALVLFVLLLFPMSQAHAQAIASRLAGTIIDGQGKSINDATLTLTNNSTHTIETAHTDASGSYSFEGLQAGT